MVDRFTLDTFAPLVGQTFHLRLDDDATVETVLQSVTEIPGSGQRPAAGAPARQPFTLVFLGPPQFVLPQRIYRFEHEAVGVADIFIVPVGRTAEGVSYEAVFS